MTRELAIKILKRMIKTGIAYDDGYAYEPLANDEERACEVAIKALEEEPCGDCVSREYMYKLGAKCIAARNENDALVAIASIESLPSVQPKPKTGHWIENEKQTHVEKIYHCSECGFEAWGEWERTNYCGGCGARMSEVSK